MKIEDLKNEVYENVTIKSVVKNIKKPKNLFMYYPYECRCYRTILHEKHLSVLDFEKTERAKEVAELEQSIFDGKELLLDIQVQQLKAE